MHVRNIGKRLDLEFSRDEIHSHLMECGIKFDEVELYPVAEKGWDIAIDGLLLRKAHGLAEMFVVETRIDAAMFFADVIKSNPGEFESIGEPGDSFGDTFSVVGVRRVKGRADVFVSVEFGVLGGIAPEAFSVLDR